jgi:hypothetical protein
MRNVKEKTVMRALSLAFLAMLAGTTIAASPAGDIAGTWECRQAGVEYRGKPPILYVADTTASNEVSVEVDGFAREVYGRSEVSGDPSGWWRVKPARGQEFLIRLEAGVKQRTPAMALRWSDAKGDYRCLRLPLTGGTGFPPLLDQGQGAPAPAPAGESPSDAPAAEPASPPPAPEAQEPAKKTD